MKFRWTFLISALLAALVTAILYNPVSLAIYKLKEPYFSYPIRLEEVIKDVRAKFNIDGKRIYATGFSNGGMFVYRLACDMPDHFAAIASVAGTDNHPQCRFREPISVFHIHAKDDQNVLFYGGSGPRGVTDKSLVTDFTSVPDTKEKWIARNGCDNDPEKIVAQEGAVCEIYSGCKENVRVKLCITEAGGHSWPGGKRAGEQSDAPSNSLSAVDQIWDFFRANINP